MYLFVYIYIDVEREREGDKKWIENKKRERTQRGIERDSEIPCLWAYSGKVCFQLFGPGSSIERLHLLRRHCPQMHNKF